MASFCHTLVGDRCGSKHDHVGPLVRPHSFRPSPLLIKHGLLENPHLVREFSRLQTSICKGVPLKPPLLVRISQPAMFDDTERYSALAQPRYPGPSIRHSRSGRCRGGWRWNHGSKALSFGNSVFFKATTRTSIEPHKNIHRITQVKSDNSGSNHFSIGFRVATN